MRDCADGLEAGAEGGAQHPQNVRLRMEFCVYEG